MVVVNPKLIKEIKTHSTKDVNVNACFNCGTCTASCPLSTEGNEFPRIMIRYGHLGLSEKILSESKIWVCSACNDCSDSCPRNATPGEYMNAVRKWAIAQYDVSGISRFLFRKSINLKISTFVVALLLTILFFGTSNFNNFTDARPVKLFDFFSYEIIRDTSIFIFGILAIIVAFSLFNMTLKILGSEGISIREGLSNARQNKKDDSIFSLLFSPFMIIKEAFKVLIFEVFGQKKQYECLTETETSKFEKLNSKWLMHVFTIWGFIGLFVATILDMFLKHDHNELVSVFYPMRLLGIISGIFFLIGVTSFILKRAFKVNKYYSNSTYEDYFILVTLWILGFTGILLTAFLYLDFVPATWAYVIFVLHVVSFYELMIFAPFTKFAHVWYRTFALWIHYSLEKRKSIVSS